MRFKITPNKQFEEATLNFFEIFDKHFVTFSDIL